MAKPKMVSRKMIGGLKKRGGTNYKNKEISESPFLEQEYDDEEIPEPVNTELDDWLMPDWD